MREIKFRVWDNHQKKMLYPPEAYYCFNKKEFRMASDKTGFVLSDIMQYIGLKDKNGKEIYEGDIVLLPDTETENVNVGIGSVPVAQSQIGCIAVVEFRDGGFGFIVNDKSETYSKGFNSFHNTDYTSLISLGAIELCKDAEIIGNKYSNPELL